MSDNSIREPMMEMYIFESRQLLERLEQIILDSERGGDLRQYIDEIFRIMHTIKGSSAMMMFDNIASVAHHVEDLFFCLREDKPDIENYTEIGDLVLRSLDFLSTEISEVEAGREPESDSSDLAASIKDLLTSIKKPASEGKDKPPAPARTEPSVAYYIPPDKSGAVLQKLYHAAVFFEEGCEMENVRAFMIVHNLKDIASEISYFPADIVDNDNSVEQIREEGFNIRFRSENEYEEISTIFSQTAFVKDLIIQVIEEEVEAPPKLEKSIVLDDFLPEAKAESEKEEKRVDVAIKRQTMISVSVDKLDMLMDLVGELVISEAMVTQNPEALGIKSENYQKAARQLRKITSDLQDVAMSIRLVPLSTTFQKMNRIVRDTSRKMNKDVELVIQGEETEVDKNVIDNISDPLMHIIRNSLDHGIESAEERRSRGKPDKGTIRLEASNAGGDVWITVRDDGQGLNREKILSKAREKGLLWKGENEHTDKEVFNYILMPGFSTKEAVTEYSGRGVGMDVVLANIEKMGGNITIDSLPGAGTTMAIKIPLTLGIIDGITVRVGSSRLTVPVTCIRESFRIRDEDIIVDPDNNEMIMVRGECYEVLRLHRLYQVPGAVERMSEGIITMVEHDGRTLCLFVDALLGEQQVVIKPLPDFIKKRIGRVAGIAGCAMLGDGRISLVIDVSGLNAS